MTLITLFVLELLKIIMLVVLFVGAVAIPFSIIYNVIQPFTRIRAWFSRNYIEFRYMVIKIDPPQPHKSRIGRFILKYNTSCRRFMQRIRYIYKLLRFSFTPRCYILIQYR